jgi:hypothetical protein
MTNQKIRNETMMMSQCSSLSSFAPKRSKKLHIKFQEENISTSLINMETIVLILGLGSRCRVRGGVGWVSK